MSTYYPAIKHRLEDLGIPQSRVADKLGIAKSSVNNKLNGNSDWTLPEARVLANWLGNSLDDLTEEEVTKD